jgi:hypothetical protein
MILAAMQEREVNAKMKPQKTRPTKRSFIGRLWSVFVALAIPERKTQVCRMRFANGIICEVRLATVGTRYQATFSEPLSPWLRPQFEEWREKVVAEFVRLHGVKISEEDLDEEFARPLPYRQPQPDPRDRGFHEERL